MQPFDRQYEQRPYENVSQLICFYCNKPGHKAIDCFYKFKDSRRMVRVSAPIQNFQQQPMRIRSVPQQIYQQRIPPIRFTQSMQRLTPRENNSQPPQFHGSPHLQESTAPPQGRGPTQPLNLPEESVVDDNEFVDALCFMTNQRRELGREGFENLPCQTEIGQKIKNLIINFENTL